MKRKALLLCIGLLAACAQQQPNYSLVVPPPPAQHPVHPRPTHASTQPHGPPNVGSAGPLQVAMIGNYMDAQEKDFRIRLHSQGIAVARIGDDIILSARDDALFSGDALSGRGRNVVERIAELLRHYDHSAVQVAGFTDTAGSPAENYDISNRRAKTIADTLVGDGVEGGRVSSQGFGSSRLKIATGPNANEPRNRRIEIHIIAHPTA